MADLETPAGGTPPPASGLSPEERAELDSLRETMAVLNPHADTIKAVVQDESLRKYVGRYGADEGFRKYLEESTKYYDDLQQRKPVNADPALVELEQRLGSKIDRIVGLVDSVEERQKAESEAKKTSVFNEAKPIVVAYLDSHPALKTSAAFGQTLNALQGEAIESGRPFKEVWDGYVSGFSTTHREAPPRQLRANASEVGIPAAQTTTPAAGEKPKSLKDAFLMLHNRGKAS